MTTQSERKGLKKSYSVSIIKAGLIGLFGVAAAVALFAPMTASVGATEDSATSPFLEIRPGSTPVEADHQIREALQSLAGMQSPEEIDILRALPHTTFLVGEDDGKYIAAVNTGPMTSSTILQCATYKACLNRDSDSREESLL